jgi:hypothetical protein
MSSRASLYVKYLRFVGRVSDWILFGILLFFALLFAFLSIYAFSAYGSFRGALTHLALLDNHI